VNVTGWSKGLDVSADGEGVVSQAGLVLLRRLVDQSGLTGGLSGRWPRSGCWSMIGGGCWLIWRVRSLMAAR
jgi:hypothetical protein